jgi:hypothetical protein
MPNNQSTIHVYIDCRFNQLIDGQPTLGGERVGGGRSGAVGATHLRRKHGCEDKPQQLELFIFLITQPLQNPPPLITNRLSSPIDQSARPLFFLNRLIITIIAITSTITHNDPTHAHT